MDAASFVVSLIDKVSGPSRDAAKALDDLEKKLKKTGRLGYHGPDGSKITARLNRQALGVWAKDRILKPVGSAAAKGIDSMTESIFRFGKYAVAAVGAAGVATAVWATKGVVHMAMFQEASKKAFGLLLGDSNKGADEFERTVGLAKQLGMNVEDTVHSMQKLLAQQFTPSDAEKWVKLGADLRAVGVDASALQRVMLDLAHVKSTGKLSQRNLNMFANAGVSTQLILEEAAKIKGTTVEGIHKLMSKGQLTSDIALPAIEAAIMRKVHEHAAGEAGAGFSNNTLSGLFAQLQNAPGFMFKRLADAAQSNVEKLKPLVRGLIDAIDHISGDEMVRFVGNVIDGVSKLVPLALEFAKGFGEGFGAINDAMGSIDPAKTSMESAKELGHAVADAFGTALKALQKIIELVNYFDQHRNIAIFSAGTLSVLRLFGAAGTAKGAWWLGKGAVKLGGMALGRSAAGAAAETAASAAGSVAAGAGARVGIGAAASAVGNALGAASGAIASAATTAISTISTTISTALSALVIGLGGAAAAAAAGAAVIGIAAAVAGWIWREQIANWMLTQFAPRTDQANHRGLDASDVPGSTAPAGTPTDLLNGARGALNRPSSTTVNMTTHVNVDGAGKDGEQLGKDIASHQRDGLEQFFQTHALESAGGPAL